MTIVTIESIDIMIYDIRIKNKLKKFKVHTIRKIWAEWMEYTRSDSDNYDKTTFNTYLNRSKSRSSDLLIEDIWRWMKKCWTYDEKSGTVWTCPGGCKAHCISKRDDH